MGKLIFTPIRSGFAPLQKLVFDEFSKDRNFCNTFYFGGGTALSVFYLQHRYSDDLDFFSEKELEPDTILKFINALSQKIGASAKITKKESVMLFEFHKGSSSLKVDFISFPYKRIEKGLSQQRV